MNGKRYPYRLRADGKPKGMRVHRWIAVTWGWTAIEDPNGGMGWPPGLNSAERTRSKWSRAGSRRTRKLARRG